MTNGIIDSYEIRYGRYNDNTDDIFSDIVTQPIFGNETFEFEVRNLQEFIEYGFQVRAITVAAGPYSDFATNITEQAGTCLYTISVECYNDFDYKFFINVLYHYSSQGWASSVLFSYYVSLLSYMYMYLGYFATTCTCTCTIT